MITEQIHKHRVKNTTRRKRQMAKLKKMKPFHHTFLLSLRRNKNNV